MILGHVSQWWDVGLPLGPETQRSLVRVTTKNLRIHFLRQRFFSEAPSKSLSVAPRLTGKTVASNGCLTLKDSQ